MTLTEIIVGKKIPIQAVQFENDKKNVTIYLESDEIENVTVFKGVKIPKKQEQVKQLYEDKDHTKDLKTMTLQLVQAMGKVCGTIILKNTPVKECKATLKIELEKCLELICAIANTIGIELNI
jgi:predicted ATP-grasp superfamily ATP-dependent carboligase